MFLLIIVVTLKTVDGGKVIALQDDGVVITQKIAEKYGINKGDTLTIEDADNETHALLVTDVAENYTANYIYMKKSLYPPIFGKAIAYNTVIADDDGDEKRLAEQLMDSGLIINVSFAKKSAVSVI